MPAIQTMLIPYFTTAASELNAAHHGTSTAHWMGSTLSLFFKHPNGVGGPVVMTVNETLAILQEDLIRIFRLPSTPVLTVKLFEDDEVITDENIAAFLMLLKARGGIDKVNMYLRGPPISPAELNAARSSFTIRLPLDRRYVPAPQTNDMFTQTGPSNLQHARDPGPGSPTLASDAGEDEDEDDEDDEATEGEEADEVDEHQPNGVEVPSTTNSSSHV